MTWIDLLGYLASAAVFATFCTTTMLRLRMLAIASNVLFVTYGLAGHIFPVALLHMTLLPINVRQLIEIRRRDGDVAGAGRSAIAIDSLLRLLTRARQACEPCRGRNRRAPHATLERLSREKRFDGEE